MKVLIVDMPKRELKIVGIVKNGRLQKCYHKQKQKHKIVAYDL